MLILSVLIRETFTRTRTHTLHRREKEKVKAATLTRQFQVNSRRVTPNLMRLNNFLANSITLYLYNVFILFDFKLSGRY